MALQEVAFLVDKLRLVRPVRVHGSFFLRTLDLARVTLILLLRVVLHLERSLEESCQPTELTVEGEWVHIVLLHPQQLSQSWDSSSSRSFASLASQSGGASRPKALLSAVRGLEILPELATCSSCKVCCQVQVSHNLVLSVGKVLLFLRGDLRRLPFTFALGLGCPGRAGCEAARIGQPVGT